MACHEISALRLGLLAISGQDDTATKSKETKELGELLKREGYLKNLAEAKNLADLRQCYEECVTSLEERLAKLKANNEDYGYTQALLVVSKKIELELTELTSSFDRFNNDLNEMHVFMHEVLDE